MTQLIQLLDKNLKYKEMNIIEDTIYIQTTSSRLQAICPYCQSTSKKVHSKYVRSFQDLPIQNKKVIIQLNNRKYFCENINCIKTTFSESFECIEFKSKKTNRLIKHIENTAMHLSSINASKILKKSVKISKSTVCNILKKNLIDIDYQTPVSVCLDDFAFKKRETYGSILVNLDNSKVIDILESRDWESVSKWLMKFPNLKIINRDGSHIYSKAIREAHPKAVQVTDYFHFLRNLTDHLKNCIIRKIPRIIKLKVNIKNNEEEIKLNQSSLKTQDKYSENELRIKVKKLFKEKKSISEICKLLSLQYRTVKKYIEDPALAKNKSLTQKQELKQSIIQEVKRLYDEIGLRKTEISRFLNLDIKTVSSYLNGKTSAIRYSEERTKSIEKYKEFLIFSLNHKIDFNEIFELIKKLGYSQSSRTLRAYIANLKKVRVEELLENNCSEADKVIINIYRSKLVSLLYKPIKEIKDISEEILIKIYKKYEWLAEIYEILSKFKNLVVSQNIDDLKSWIETAERSDIKEIQSFIKGIYRDFEGIQNAIKYRTTNGLAEGSVNKLKTIKRTMYGKASFETLRKKLLWSYDSE